jgi:hypothetical protein
MTFILPEVLDFAEFLRDRQECQQVEEQNSPLIALCDGLANSTTFAGSPAIKSPLSDPNR